MKGLAENNPSTEPEGKPSVVKDPYTMGTLCHLLGLVGFLGIPFGSVIAPLILWLVKKNEDAFLDATGKEVINFQISIVIYTIIATLSLFIVVGIILLPLFLILALVYTIIGAIKASNGVVYRYPLTFRFIK